MGLLNRKKKKKKGGCNKTVEAMKAKASSITEGLQDSQWMSFISAGLMLSSALNKDAAAWKRVAQGLLAAGTIHRAGTQLAKKKEKKEEK